MTMRDDMFATGSGDDYYSAMRNEQSVGQSQGGSEMSVIPLSGEVPTTIPGVYQHGGEATTAAFKCSLGAKDLTEARKLRNPRCKECRWCEACCGGTSKETCNDPTVCPKNCSSFPKIEPIFRNHQEGGCID